MTARPCTPLAADRSALVDGALSGDRRERLLVHLVHCQACRADVTELRQVRAVLQRPPARETPQDLTARLVAIAGPEAALPLWSRPFRRTPRGALSSPRRRLRRRATATAVALGALVVGAGVTGYVAAPPNALAALGDPSPQAQAAFGTALRASPLADTALQALGSVGWRADPATPAGGGPVEPTLATTALSARAARDTLDRAAAAAGTVPYTGVEALRSRSGERTLQATVAVSAVPGQGVQAQLLDGDGQQVGTGFAPAGQASRMVDDTVLKMLDQHYDLRAWSGARALGRPAVLVEAAADGTRAARWWVDDATGLVLARQTFDARGQEAAAMAFTSLEVGPAAAPGRLPVRLALPGTGTALTVSAAADLAQQGWVCRDELAGLSLVRLRSDADPARDVVHLVYTDGLTTLSVVEQRGELSAAPEGSRWDATLGAHITDGATRLASWQSGDTVFTVVTDGTTDALAAAVTSLPHDPSPERSTMGRIREGWARLLADTKG